MLGRIIRIEDGMAGDCVVADIVADRDHASGHPTGIYTIVLRNRPGSSYGGTGQARTPVAAEFEVLRCRRTGQFSYAVEESVVKFPVAAGTKVYPRMSYDMHEAFFRRVNAWDDVQNRPKETVPDGVDS